VKAFRYERAKTTRAAVAALSAQAGAPPPLLKASGIDVLDRMKERVDEPERVVTIADVPGLAEVRRTEAGLSIGAMTTLAALAESKDVREACPALAEAAGAAASPQIRARATIGGNVAQHTRCGYYRMRSFECFKRGDARCPVLEPGAVQETNGVFGNADCACAHPSSLAPVLGAARATFVVEGGAGERRVAFEDLWTAPVRGKRSDTTLAADDVIVRVEIPAFRAGPDHLAYEEVRQRAAFDWALVSCGVWFVGGEQAIKDARIWLGSVAPAPWRAKAAEKALVDKPWSAALAAAAGEAAAEGATPLPGNAYKLDLVKVAVRRAVEAAWSGKR
jgi:xanthine dehydrogenase YagS FAD-binding subunit